MKTTIVTGASTGIGRATSILLSKNGYSVYLLARNKDKLEETKKLIADQNGQAEVVVTDLSSVDSINEAIKSIKEKTQGIDLLVNIAGVWHGENDVYAGKDFEIFDQKVIMETYRVGILAPTLLAHAFIPLMKAGAKIINLSGTFEDGAKGWLPYYVSKRAIEDLTIALSQELEGKDIQVNCVSPSDTATEAYGKFFPQYMENAIKPEEIAEKILELASPVNKNTGRVIIMKKNEEPRNGFHF